MFNTHPQGVRILAWHCPAKQERRDDAQLAAFHVGLRPGRIDIAGTGEHRGPVRRNPSRSARQLRHVAGASLGFTLLLVLIGLGLHELLTRWPGIIEGVRWAGVAFLGYMAIKLGIDDGRLGDDDNARGPSMLQGAIMQWLNPRPGWLRWRGWEPMPPVARST